MRNGEGGVSFPTISDWFDHQLLSEMVKCRTRAKSPFSLLMLCPEVSLNYSSVMLGCLFHRILCVWENVMMNGGQKIKACKPFLYIPKKRGFFCIILENIKFLKSASFNFSCENNSMEHLYLAWDKLVSVWHALMENLPEIFTIWQMLPRHRSAEMRSTAEGCDAAVFSAVSS